MTLFRSVIKNRLGLVSTKGNPAMTGPAIKKKVIKTLTYSVVTDETDRLGFTCIYTRDSRGYFLAANRYGGRGWPTRTVALASALAGAR